MPRQLNEEMTGQCGGCDGACCRQGVIIEFTDQEAAFMRAGGTQIEYEFTRLVPAKRAAVELLGYQSVRDQYLNNLKEALYNPATSDEDHDRLRVMWDVLAGEDPQRPRYILGTDCGYLNTGVVPATCTVYDDPNKPRICSDFEAGSYHCENLRERGIQIGLQIIPKPGTIPAQA